MSEVDTGLRTVYVTDEAIQGGWSRKRRLWVGDRARSEIIQANERIKGISGVLHNLGTGTFGAFGARFIVKDGVDLVGSGWLVAAFLFIWVGSKLLTLLEADL